MNVTCVAVEQRNSDPDLRLAEIFSRHPDRVVERGDAFLPAVSEFVAVPVEHGGRIRDSGFGGQGSEVQSWDDE